MKNLWKRLIGMMLSVVLVAASIPINVEASGSENSRQYKPTDQAVTISAESENTITVRQDDEEEDNPDEETEGILKLQEKDYSITRDYQQQCMITVTNSSDKAQNFYLEAINNYQDISLEIVKAGSKNNPMLIAAGESLEVELSVFAQNAVQEQYQIPVTAYILQDGEYVEDAKITAELNCGIPKLEVSWNKISEDTSILSQKFTVTNNGETLTDLDISASGDIENYVSFSPIISNYELPKGKSVEVTVRPDLAKMKNDGIQALTGTLIASCAGQISSVECSFDTKGQEITTTTMGELALKQDENPFTKFEVVEDSISLQYFDGEAYQDAVSADSVDALFGENNKIDFQFSTDVDLGTETPAKFAITMKSSEFYGDESDINSDPQVQINENNEIELHTQTYMTAEEYEEFIQTINAQEDTAVTETEETSQDEELVEESEVNADSTLEQAQSTENLELYSASTSSATNDEENNSSGFIVDMTLSVGGMIDATNPPGTSGSILSSLGNVKTVYDITIGAAKSYAVTQDPRIDFSTKTVYVATEIFQQVLNVVPKIIGKVNPAVGVIYDALWIAMDFDGKIEAMQSQWLEEAYANYGALYEDVLGYQCTNRGSIGTTFYAPDYGRNSDKSPSMYVSSRMYEEDDSYTDQADTNYDITLNGEPAGTTQNTGVTDIAMAEVSTDNLKPGESNVIEMDYDTFPGHYFVSTDTEITLLYPSDTEIAYIGNPDNLQNVRTQPDFEIHPENIYVQNELIAGETAALSFNIYNTGSRGGWFNIVVTEGDEQIYIEENHYLGAFTGETINIDWIPSAGANEVTVSLENTSIELEEKDVENNSATKSFSVREREIPVISGTYTDTIYTNSLFTISSDILNSADVSDVKFYINGTALEGTVNSSPLANGRRYWITSTMNIDAGEYSGMVEVLYNGGNSQEVISEEFDISVLEQEIQIPSAVIESRDILLSWENFDFTVNNTENFVRAEICIDEGDNIGIDPSSTDGTSVNYSVSTKNWGSGTHTISIFMYYQVGQEEKVQTTEIDITILPEEESFYNFVLDDTISNPYIYIFDSSGNTVNYESIVVDNTYKIQKTIEMYESPSDYSIIIQNDKGIIVQPLDTSNITFSNDECNTLTIQNNDNIEISTMTVESIGDMNYSNISLPISDSLLLSPQMYTLYITGYYSGTYFSTRTTIDMLSGDQTLNIEDLLQFYYFQIEEPQYNGYGANLYYRSEGSSYWNGFVLNTVFDSESGLLKCFTANNSYKDYIANAEEIRIVVYSDTEIYVTLISPDTDDVVKTRAASSFSSEQYITLSRESLQKVTLTCEESNLKLNKVNVDDGVFNLALSGNVIYLPYGKYLFTSTLDTGYQTIANTVDVTVEEDCIVTVDEGLNEILRDVKISWAECYDSFATVNTYMSGNYVYANNFASGDSFKVNAGAHTFTIELYQENNRFIFSHYLSDIDDDGTEIKVGQNLNGKITTSFDDFYQTGDTVNLYISNICDEYENSLNGTSISSSQPLYGNLSLKDVETGEIVTEIPVVATSLSISFTVPEISGTFSIEVELYSYAIEDDTEHIHTEVIDPEVPATCTADGMTQGSHCSVCGEVIVPQEVIPALGHDYVYEDNTDGTHSVTCTRCDYNQIEKHTYENNVCKFCNSKMPEAVCVGRAEVEISEDTLELSLGGSEVGTFSFCQKNNGWTIQDENGMYIAVTNGKIEKTKEEFIWTYSNGKFSTKVASRGWLWFKWTTTYYLVGSNKEIGISRSSKEATAKFYTSVNNTEHTYGEWIGENGKHTHTCIYCGYSETKDCKYDSSTHKCVVCGSYDPAIAYIEVSVESTKHNRGFWFWRTSYYTINISTKSYGTEIAKIEYSLDNESWKNGDSFTSKTEVDRFYIRVTDAEGTVYNWLYSDGDVTEIK